MWKPRRGPMGLLASLPILGLAACATPTPPPSSGAAAQIFDPVPVYEKGPCWMQRKWSAHNSKVDTLKQGREVVYKPPCDVDPKPKAPPAAKPPPVAEVDAERSRLVASR